MFPDARRGLWIIAERAKTAVVIRTGIRRAAVSIRAISVAVLAVGLAGGLVGGLVACAPVFPPGAPDSGLSAPSEIPPGWTPANYPTPSDSDIDDDEPIYALPNGAGVPPYAGPARIAPNAYSGSSAPPRSGRAVSRAGRARPTGERVRRWLDLDDTDLQAQWINPPLGAGE
jgi:hypothetical protein